MYMYIEIHVFTVVILLIHLYLIFYKLNIRIFRFYINNL